MKEVFRKLFFVWLLSGNYKKGLKMYKIYINREEIQYYFMQVLVMHLVSVRQL